MVITYIIISWETNGLKTEADNLISICNITNTYYIGRTNLAGHAQI